jgi:hypothetical protein
VSRRSALVLLVLLGCTSASETWRARAAAYERAGQHAAALDAAEHAVESDPSDGGARLSLARLAASAGRPGEALRQYEAALSLGESAARAPLAALYAARGRARAALGQRSRWRDLERAVALDPERAAALESERRAARLDAGLFRWARGDLEGAHALWAGAPGPHPSAVERVMADPERAPLVLVGAIGARAYQIAGAAAAWPLLDAYARRHGDDSRVAEVIAAAHRQLDAGAPAPGWRAAPGESGVVALDAALAWTGSAPLAGETVAEVVALAARAWLHGERDAPVDGALVAWVSRAITPAQLGELPRWARAPVARLLGDARAAHEAHAAGPGEFPIEAAALVALEWPEQHAAPPNEARGADARTRWLAAATLAHRGGDAAAEARALAALAGDAGAWTALAARGDLPALAWRRGVDRSRFAAAEGVARATAERGLVRWRGLVAKLDGGADAAASIVGDGLDAQAYGQVTAAATDADDEPALLAPPHGCDDTPAERAGLAEVVRSSRADAAEGARRARAWLDGALVPSCRGLPLVGFYLDAADPARARRLADELLALEPGDAEALAYAIAAAAVQKDGQAARLYLEQAEYWSVARGTPSLAAAARFVSEGLPVEAIGSARQALALADGATRFAAYEMLCVSSLAAGRTDDAAHALATYLAELPEDRRDQARRRVAARAAALGVDVSGLADLRPARPGERERALAEGGVRLEAYAALVPDDADAIGARAQAAAGRADAHAAAQLLDAGLRRLPWALPLLVARARLEPKATPARVAAEARLLLVGLGANDPTRRGVALAAFATLVDEDGHPALAARARAAVR